MYKLQTLIKDKQSRYKQHGVKEVFKKEDGAIDLASIMVGVIVIGLIGGVIAATVFAVIPWAQDNAAKQQLDSIVQAENAYFGLSSANPSPLPTGYKTNSFGKSAELANAKLLSIGQRYCVTTPDDGKSYTGYSQSSSGSIFTVTDKNTKPEPLMVPTGTKAVDSLPSDCQFITEGMTDVSNSTPAITPTPSPTPSAPYVDPTPTKFIMTYQCDVTTNGVQSPILTSSGTHTWNDGTTSTTKTSNGQVTLTGGVKYTYIFEGTFISLDSASNSGGVKCIRSVDHWGASTGTTTAYRAFLGATNLIGVPANIPSTITNMFAMFNGATSLNDPNVKNWDVSKVTNMSSMFRGATSFNQDLSAWKTGLVTDMSFMFYGASAMNGGLNSWDTSKVTNMDSMFYGASSFNQPLDKWVTTNVTNMLLMFYGTPYSQNIAGWDMNKVNKMGLMMNDPDSNLVARTTHPNMFRMTYQCDVTTSGVQSPILSSSGTHTWSDGTTKTSNGQVTLTGGVKYTYIFEGTFSSLDSASNSTGVKCIRSVDHWGAATGTTTAYRAFLGATNLTGVPANIPSTLTNMTAMFSDATSLNDPDVMNWNVSKVNNMSSMFRGATSFNQDLSGWNTGLVTDMSFMFHGASAMNGGLNSWDTSKVTNMDSMFYRASSFNQPLDKWVTTNVTNMLLMFYGTPYSQNITSWDMNKVNKMGLMMNDPDSNLVARTTHPNMFRMTYQCDVTTSGVQSPILSSSGTHTWSNGTTKTSNGQVTLTGGVKYTYIFEGTFSSLDSASNSTGVKCIRSVDHWGAATGTSSAYRAFLGATNLTGVPANIPSTITDMFAMFSGATSFNDPDVKNWDVSKVTNMSSMFLGATSFNQDLKSSWNTAAVTSGTTFAPASFPDAYMPDRTSK